MAYEKQREDFSETRARWLSHRKLPLLNTDELTRSWKTVTDGQKATSLAFLNAYVSAKNTNPSTTVVDPQADGSGANPDGSPKNVFSGTWRHVSTSWDAQNELYVQVLRLGWLTNLLTAGAPNDECMVNTASDSAKDPRAYVLYWRNIASTAVASCLNELRSVPNGAFTDPMIQGEQKLGTYVIGTITPKQEDDGSYSISVETIKATSVSSISDLANMVPSKKGYTHDVENPFGVLGLYDDVGGRKPRDSIVYQYRAITSSSLSTLRSLSDIELLTLLGSPDNTAYKTVQRKIDEDAAGTVQIAIAWQWIPLATTITDETARFVGLERKNQSGKIIITLAWPRIDPAVIDTVMGSALAIRDTATNPVVEGKTYTGEYIVNTTVSRMTNEDCVQITQTLTKAGDQKLDVITGVDPNHKLYEFYRWDISTVEVDDFLTETDTEAHAGTQYNWNTPENGRTKSVRISKNEDDSFTLYATYSDTTDLKKLNFSPLASDLALGRPFTVRSSYAVLSERAFGWNIPVTSIPAYAAYYSPVSAVVNQRNQFNISRQTEHVFDFTGVRETVSTLDSGWIVLSDDEFKKVEARRGAFILLAELADDAATAFGRPSGWASLENIRYDKEFQRNELGSYDGQIVRTTFYKYDSGDVEVLKNEFKTVVRREGRYLKSSDITTGNAFVRPAAVENVVIELSEKDNDVRTKDIVKVKTTYEVYDSGDITVEDTSARTVTRREGRYLTAAYIIATSAFVYPDSVPDNTTIEFSSKDNEAGTKDIVVVTTLSKDQTNTGGSTSKLENVAVTEHTAAAAEAALSASVPVNRQEVVDNSENPDGSKRTKKTVSDAQPWDSGAAVVVSDDGVTKQKQRILKNQTSVAPADMYQELSVRDNSRGGFDIVEITNLLSSGANGVKYVQSTNVRDFDIRSREVRTPTWSVTTNSSVDADVTGYNVWLVAMSRSRNISTTITKTYVTTEPTALTASMSVDGDSEGAGTSYSKEVRKVAKGIWEIIDRVDVSGPYTAFADKTITWMGWIQTVVGSGE